MKLMNVSPKSSFLNVLSGLSGGELKVDHAAVSSELIPQTGFSKVHIRP